MTEAQNTEITVGINAGGGPFLNEVLTERRGLTVGFAQSLVTVIK